MAQRITVNQSKGSLGSSSLVVVSDQTGFLNLNGGINPANTAGETINQLFVSEVVWSQANTANWAISRGGNTVWTCYGENGYIDFKEHGYRLETGGDAQANVAFTLSGGAGNIILKLTKNSGA